MLRNALLTGSVLAAALGGCGGDDGHGSSSPGDRAFEGALKFASCMRENGVDMPDPQRGANGMVKMVVGRGKDVPGGTPHDPVFHKAEEACRKHLAQTGAHVDEETRAEHRDAFLAYARCMRAEGLNVPDPGPEGGVRFRVGDPTAPNPESAAFKKADGVCHKHLAQVDKDLAVEGSP